jgi:glycosyltransferase involved in cell wall biosynthesis
MKKVLYVVPAPPPRIPGTDGLFTEIGYLRKSVDGNVISLSPVRSLPRFVPVRLYGIQHLKGMKKLTSGTDIIHVIFPYPADFWILRHYTRNVVYTITSGVDPDTLPASPLPYSFVVSSESEARILRSHGYRKVHVIPPGIEMTPFQDVPAPPEGDEFVILAGSAPWVKSQFASKGFDLLLDLLARVPRVRLICLFRGTLHREWCRRVGEAGLSDRVETVNEKADVARIMARCHAAIVLASRPDLVKSYPNSLMEALAAGRPVIVSRTVPISEFIGNTGSGTIVEDLSIGELTLAVSRLMNNYPDYREAVRNIPPSHLSSDRMAEEYRKLYGKVPDSPDE